MDFARFFTEPTSVDCDQWPHRPARRYEFDAKSQTLTDEYEVRWLRKDRALVATRLSDGATLDERQLEARWGRLETEQLRAAWFATFDPAALEDECDEDAAREARSEHAQRWSVAL